MAENTIAENLQRLINAKSDIGDAIIAKGGTVGSNDGFEEFAADIATIPTGGGTTPSNDVNFYDYDGTIVHSYSADDFANLSELPSNPSHEGLTSQGWNWSLADAKTYVASYNRLNIGQMYITSDGKTRIYITLSEGRTSPILQLYLNDNSELDIDWGDGSTHSTFINNSSAGYKNERHEYHIAGNYVITISVITGGFMLNSSYSNASSILWNGEKKTASLNVAYNNAVKKVEIGSGVTSIGDSAFNNCYSLSSITIPNTVTSIGMTSFKDCYSLSSITIPNTVTSIGIASFSHCYSLSSITIPNTVTSIGATTFSHCYSLSSITIPNTVTSIGEAAFASCYSLSSITIPNTVTSIGEAAFDYCHSLSSINIPSGVTSIGEDTFSSCYSLSSITIPNTVRSIGTYAFSYCSYMSYIKFKSTTPPTVSSSSAWSSVSTSTKILVPTGTLETYKSATNYPNPSTFTYEEY